MEKNEEVIFRKAYKDDIKQLVDMRIEYLLEDLGDENIGDLDLLRENLMMFFIEHLENDLEAFVAERNGEIISTSFNSYYYRIPHPKFPHGIVGVPINGYTKPNYRKEGFAGKLLKLSAEYAKKRGVEMLHMEVTKKGLPVSKEVGFTEITYTPVQMLLEGEG